MDRLRTHWPEYLIEATCLGLFMLSAAGFATLLQHPASPLARLVGGWHTPAAVRRLPMGVAMGLTAVGLIYSPLGRRSGAHLNPAVTLTFLRLGKIARPDAVFYVFSQFIGGSVGIVAAAWLFQGLPAHPAVNYVATVPGAMGSLVAFAGEASISFLMMTTVLTVSNTPSAARWTGLCAGALVALFIVFEAPLSGMSMNPARSFGSSLPAHTAGTLWIYFAAPSLGMLLAGERYVRRHGAAAIRCAKLNHPATGPCIFHCTFNAPTPRFTQRSLSRPHALSSPANTGELA